MLDNKESEESDIIVIKLSDEELKDMNKILDKVSERSNDYNSVQDSNSELENSFENFKEFKVLLKSVCDKENHNSQNLPQIKRKCNQNFSRWAKNKDKEVFNFLHKLLYKLSITMEEFFDFDPSTMFNEASLKIRRRLQREVITKLCKETNCNKEPYFLLKRILKKYACQKFTDSEINSLRRIINSLKPGSVVNIHKILYHFPGKTPRTMKAVIRDIMSHTLIEK